MTTFSEGSEDGATTRDDLPVLPHPDATQEPDYGTWAIVSTEPGPWHQPEPTQQETE